MQIIEYFSVNNDCYKNNKNKVDQSYVNFQNNGPQGIMLHSVGCAQSKAQVFANTWNKSGIEVAVHAVLQADGTVIHCLPWNYKGWHCGGSANNTHIGIEMTEPDCIQYIVGSTFVCNNLSEARKQATGTYNTAVNLFADICKKYNLDPLKDGVIISHSEGNKRGIAFPHDDCEHLWRQLGMSYTMDGFRRDVKKAMTYTTSDSKSLYRIRKSWENVTSQVGAYLNLDNAKQACDKAGSDYYIFDMNGNIVYPIDNYKVKVIADALNIRDGAGTNYKINGCIRDSGVYTIIKEQNGWGLLKSKAGWICLDYTKRI